MQPLNQPCVRYASSLLLIPISIELLPPLLLITIALPSSRNPAPSFRPCWKSIKVSRFQNRARVTFHKLLLDPNMPPPSTDLVKGPELPVPSKENMTVITPYMRYLPSISVPSKLTLLMQSVPKWSTSTSAPPKSASGSHTLTRCSMAVSKKLPTTLHFSQKMILLHLICWRTGRIIQHQRRARDGFGI